MWECDQVCMCSLECLAGILVPKMRSYYCCCCYCWWLWSSLSSRHTVRRQMAHSRHHNKCQIDSDATERRRERDKFQIKNYVHTIWIWVSCNESSPLIIVVVTYCNASIASAFWTWHLEISAQQIGTIFLLT